MKVSNEDLSVAIMWLESYEASADDEAKLRCQRVADWLQGELDDRAISRIVRVHKVSRSLARQVVANAKEGK